MKRQHPPAVLDFCSKGSGGQLLCIDGEASEARECTLDFLFAVQRHQARRVGQMGLRQPGPPTSWNAKTFSGGGGGVLLWINVGSRGYPLLAREGLSATSKISPHEPGHAGRRDRDHLAGRLGFLMAGEIRHFYPPVEIYIY